jgi:MFS superfamily sulfate permease-like transporter
MNAFLIFIFGLCVGVIIGFLTAALFVVSRQADERIERENRGSPGDEA